MAQAGITRNWMDSVAEHPQLGRLIFERRGKSFLRSLHNYLILASFLVAILIILNFSKYLSANENRPVVARAWAELPWLIGTLVFALVLLLYVIPRFIKTFRCYQYGVELARKNHSLILPFDRITKFVYGNAINSQYPFLAVTDFVIRVDGMNDGEAVSIRYREQTHKKDSQVCSFPAIACHQRSAEIVQQVCSGQKVPWTANMTFTSSGLLCIQRSGHSEIIPYQALEAVDLKHGHLSLWADQSGKPVFKSRSDLDDFYPGFFALLDLIYGAPANMEPELFGPPIEFDQQ